MKAFLISFLILSINYSSFAKNESQLDSILNLNLKLIQDLLVKDFCMGTQNNSITTENNWAQSLAQLNLIFPELEQLKYDFKPKKISTGTEDIIQYQIFGVNYLYNCRTNKLALPKISLQNLNKSLHCDSTAKTPVKSKAESLNDLSDFISKYGLSQNQDQTYRKCLKTQFRNKDHQCEYICPDYTENIKNRKYSNFDEQFETKSNEHLETYRKLNCEECKAPYINWNADLRKCTDKDGCETGEKFNSKSKTCFRCEHQYQIEVNDSKVCKTDSERLCNYCEVANTIIQSKIPVDRLRYSQIIEKYSAMIRNEKILFSKSFCTYEVYLNRFSQIKREFQIKKDTFVNQCRSQVSNSREGSIDFQKTLCSQWIDQQYSNDFSRSDCFLTTDFDSEYSGHLYPNQNEIEYFLLQNEIY